jgi:hypothetical protein
MNPKHYFKEFDKRNAFFLEKIRGKLTPEGA